MHINERDKCHVISRNGLQLVVVIYSGDYFSHEVFYCLSDRVITF